VIKIYDYKTGKLREIMLEAGERNYLCKKNLLLIKEHVNEQEKEKEQRGS